MRDRLGWSSGLIPHVGEHLDKEADFATIGLFSDANPGELGRLAQLKHYINIQ
jgi:hypothetical protein